MDADADAWDAYDVWRTRVMLPRRRAERGGADESPGAREVEGAGRGEAGPSAASPASDRARPREPTRFEVPRVRRVPFRL